jgi:hypothetical protein
MATCLKAHQDVASPTEHIRVPTLDKGKAEEAHTGSKAKLALLTAQVTKARGPAQKAVQLQKQLETQVIQDTAAVEALEVQVQEAKTAVNAASAESIAAQQASQAHKTATDAADYAIKAFEAAKQVHQTVRAAVETARAVSETSAGCVREATDAVERLTITTKLAVTDREMHAPQEAADQRNVLQAITDLTKLQTAHQTLVEAAVKADTAQESDEAARKERYPFTQLKVRTPPPLPIHGAGAATSPAIVTQPSQP